ncbi:MAG: Txe/YoeB family addiction module toxin [Pseudomonadota bacterium]
MTSSGSWSVILSRQAIKDLTKLRTAGLAPATKKLLFLLAEDPFATPPRFEKLVGNLQAFFARRINIQHRLVYSIDEEKRLVHILRMWTHYK